MRGVVISGIGGLFTVRNTEGESFHLRAQSKLRHKKLKPLTGDFVEFEPGTGDEDGWLSDILPRNNELVRPPVANIDVMCIVISASVPKADLLLADRLLIFAGMNKIRAMIVINKADEDTQQAEKISAQYASAGCDRVIVSAQTGYGIEELKRMLQGTVHVFCGQSGVGKSSLMNRLYGFSAEVGEISEKIERGKNTTRHCELRPVDGGGMVLDTPGFSLLELPLMEPEKLRERIPELIPYEGKCRFLGCVHISEPDCPVRDAVEAGTIDRERYQRYRILFDDMRERWRNRYD